MKHAEALRLSATKQHHSSIRRQNAAGQDLAAICEILLIQNVGAYLLINTEMMHEVFMILALGTEK
jgi:hypothetical protein